MAKKVYPGAEFEPCANEIIPFSFDLFARISLLAPLPAKARENLEKCTGAMRLRRFRQNELICRQGEEDCTAFYILKTEDLETLCGYPKKRAEQASLEIESLRKKLAETQQTLEKACAESKAKEIDKLQKQIKDGQEKLAGWQRVLDQLPELSEKLKVLEVPAKQLALLGSAVQADEEAERARVLRALRLGDVANVQLEQLEQQAISVQDNSKAAYFRELRAADIAKKRHRADRVERERPELAQLLRASARGTELRRAAVVYLGDAPKGEAKSAGWLDRLKRSLLKPPPAPTEKTPLNIPFDGPTEVNARTRQAILYEGELFGEMACLNRAPRSATVVADRDCYILEMLSNILMEIDKDPGYQKERARIYEERVLDLQLRALSIFADLSDEQFAEASVAIRGQLKLRTLKSGDVICDEHERSDSVYLVRSGLVQVKKNVSSLLSAQDIINWPGLVVALNGAGPAAALRELLTPSVRALLEATRSLDHLTASQCDEFVHGLNEIIRNTQVQKIADFAPNIARASLYERVRSSANFQAPRLYDPKELDDVIKTASVREAKKLEPGKVEKWSDLDHRRFNRWLLEAILPNCVRPLPAASGPDAVLTYLSRGEFIGEMGVCRRQPRSSTCVAFGQPRNPKEEDLGVVELVQIPGEVFLGLIELFPEIKASVETEILRRQKRDLDHTRQNRPAESHASKAAERLGLIQGQQLMLIDMERCTMCLECVKACVDSHADGRSRLFLVGHRYEKYMVPITCRACLDPVCMIGCPVRSIQRGDNREIVIKDWCVGCRLCAKNCPYDAIKMHDLPSAETLEMDGATTIFRIRDEIATVCDLCSSLADQTPRCVYACPHEAAIRVNARVELPIV